MTDRRVCKLLAGAACALAACGRRDSAPPPGALAIDVRNVGLQATLVASEAFLTFGVEERSQGGRDLNGDGDSLDVVLHTFSRFRPGMMTVNLEQAGGRGAGDLGIRASSTLVAYVVDEAAQAGTDLNGDGDALDRVLHLHGSDPRFVLPPPPEVTRNLGFAIVPPPAFRGGFLAFLVSEADQGAGDLNGDGDVEDSVVHIRDVLSGSTANLRLAAGGDLELDSLGNLAFRVSEAAQGSTDLNGDGDAVDFVVHVSTGVVRNLGLATHELSVDVAGIGGNPLHLDHGLVAFTSSEAAQGGTDLNRDGDLLDRVLHVHDIETGLTYNSGVHSADHVVGSGFVAVSVPEASQGASDLNADGDARDSVLHLVDRATGVTSNVGSAVEGIQVAPGSATFLVPEHDEGGRDLNADGDDLDLVLHLLLVETAEIRNLGFATRAHHVRTLRNDVVFSVPEAAQGGTDLNGDGDALDDVMHLHDIGDDHSVSLGVAGALVDERSGNLAFLVQEETEDLNGDGDLMDLVFHVLPLYPMGSPESLGLAGTLAPTRSPSSGGTSWPILVSESEQGEKDLNGDGDTADLVLFHAQIQFRL